LALNMFVIKSPLSFTGFKPNRSRTPYSVLGVPFDSSSSFRSGQRWGPRAIREASAYIEYYSIHAEEDLSDVPIYDEGDVAVVYGDVHETLTRVREVVKDLVIENRIPIILGGEHTITLGVVQGLTHKYKKPCLIIFDAHFDLRDEYLGNRLSHACVSKRILELVKPYKVYFIGVRAFSREEKKLADEIDLIDYSDIKDIVKLGEANIAARARKFLEDCKEIYLSIDIDVLDPAYAPGVANPEPEGLTSWSLFELIHGVVDDRLIGFDVVEVSPPYDHGGITSITAAKTVIEVIAAHRRRLRENLSNM
jgi:agmatinase